MTRHRRELIDLAGSAASDTRTIDIQLVGDTIEDLPQSGKRNGVAAAVPIEEEA